MDKERVANIARRLKDKCIDHDTIGGRGVVILTSGQAQELTEVILELLEKINGEG